MSINPEQWEVFAPGAGLDTIYRYPPGGGPGESFWKIDPATAPRYRSRQCDSLGVFILPPIFLDEPGYIESATAPATLRRGVLWHNPALSPPTTKVLTADSPAVYTPISGARTKIQTADQPLLTNTLTNASDLFIDVEAGATYAVFGQIMVTVALPGIGLQCDVTGPGIALAAVHAHATSANGVTKWDTTDGALGVVHAANILPPQVGTAIVRFLGGIKIGGAPGTLRFRFAQLVLNLGSPVVLRGGSFLSLTEKV